MIVYGGTITQLYIIVCLNAKATFIVLIFVLKECPTWQSVCVCSTQTWTLFRGCTTLLEGSTERYKVIDDIFMSLWNLYYIGMSTFAWTQYAARCRLAFLTSTHTI